MRAGRLEKAPDGTVFASVRREAREAMGPSSSDAVADTVTELLAAAAIGVQSLWLTPELDGGVPALLTAAAGTLEQLSAAGADDRLTAMDAMMLGPGGPGRGAPSFTAFADSLRAGTARRRDCEDVLKCYRAACGYTEVGDFIVLAWRAASRLRGRALELNQEGRDRDDVR